MKRVEHALEIFIFNARWLLAPFYLGLVLALGVLQLATVAISIEFPMTLERAALVFALTLVMCGLSGAIALQKARTADRILMSDDTALYTKDAPSRVAFNHASSGGSYNFWSDESINGQLGSPEAFIAYFEGMNELMGDGHVRWVSRGEMPPDKIVANPSNARRCGTDGKWINLY